MVKKQTIQSEFYTPTGAPPAGCSVIPGLNNPQRGSASEVVRGGLKYLDRKRS